MKRASLRFILLLSLAAPQLTARAQQSDAAALAQRQEMDERYKRLLGELQDLRDAYEAQRKRISSLVDEVQRLREQSQETARGQAAFASREDLKRLYEKVDEIETKRDADKKLILEEFQKLSKAFANMPAPAIPAPKNSDRDDVPAQDVYVYTVKSGDTLSAIVAAYNEKYKEEGKTPLTTRQVEKVNPGVKWNNLQVGKKINIPKQGGKD